MPRKPKNEWYKDNFVSEKVLNKPLDTSKGFKWSTSPTKESLYPTETDKAIAKAEYEANNLSFYESKEDMRKSLGAKFWNNHDLDKYWSQYVKRDSLIANGQYASIRMDIYRKSYENAFIQSYAVEDERARYIMGVLNSLTDDEFYALGHVPVPKEFWKKDKKTGQPVPTYQSNLPDISDFYATGNPEADMNEIIYEWEENLREGYKKIGKRYVPYDEYINEDETDEDVLQDENQDWLKDYESKTKKKIENLYKRAKKKNPKGKYTKNAARLVRQLSQEQRENIIRGASDKEIEVRYIIQNRDRYIGEGGKLLKKGKKGYYIPFMHKEAVKEAVRRLRKARFKI